MTAPVTDFLSRQPTLRPRWRTLLWLSLTDARERRIGTPGRARERLAIWAGVAFWLAAFCALGRLRGWW